MQPSGGLSRNSDFLKLWTGESVSLFGSQITALALPLTAVLVLKATPAQMGLLGTLQFAPFLIVGLFAGVWVDRLRRRPILIGADLGRAVLLGSIPVAAALDRLQIGQLYAVAFLTGVLTVFFDVAYQSFLPSLVRRDQLVDGNSRLEVSSSVAQVAGPSLAGVLLQVASAPFTIAFDAASFLASGFFIGLIRGPEPAPRPRTERRSVWVEIGEGLRLVAGNRLLRPIAASTATSNLFGGMTTAVFVLYIVRQLQIEPGALGLIFAGNGLGALAGAVVAAQIARWIGLGRALIAARVVSTIALLSVPLFSGPVAVVAPLIGVAWLFVGFGSPIYNINQVSLRQAITPDRLQGRLNATMRFLVWGTIPIGSLLGGALGGTIGIRQTLLISGVGQALSILWLVFSPVRRLRRQPMSATEVPAG